MILSELGEKADFIARRRRELNTLWHQYGNTLTQAITQTKTPLHLSINCSTDNGLSFWLFSHFLIAVRPDANFNDHRLYYRLETRENQPVAGLGEARLGDDGLLDGAINIRQKEAVLLHFLHQVRPVYDLLYQAVERGESLKTSSFEQLFHQAKSA
ncbi:hypothetical protein BTJ39_09395 [Izhakiella australiensis]|uniref:Uncharacterized protein n=2 Tax=Izhakiella australiensis TaxID=1926881 RepID=A0A1S8YME6_9GAMM|nr:hypothetical protein BTJ39_09395 [Izhakiella australiensis]